jgi:hypothetical protein
VKLWRRLFPKYECRNCKDTGIQPAYRAGNWFSCACPCPRCERGVERQREIEKHFDEVVMPSLKGLPPKPPIEIVVRVER